MKNPYRRAFIEATLKRQTRDSILFDFLTENLPQILLNYIDVHGTSLINALLVINGGKDAPQIKGIFNKKEKRKKGEPVILGSYVKGDKLIRIRSNFE